QNISTLNPTAERAAHQTLASVKLGNLYQGGLPRLAGDSRPRPERKNNQVSTISCYVGPTATGLAPRLASDSSPRPGRKNNRVSTISCYVGRQPQDRRQACGDSRPRPEAKENQVSTISCYV